jgi:DNA-binding transcriptional regulator LsrR (DeoR family)
MANKWDSKAQLLRERELQVQYGLSIQQSVIVAGLEQGWTQTELAGQMGITRQALHTALRAAQAKMAKGCPP